VKVWLPAIRGGSGVDVHTRRMVVALRRHGINAETSCFPTYLQFAPFLLSSASPPPGTDIVHALSWYGFAFKRQQIPLLVTEQLDVFDPVYRSFKNFAQHVYHELLVRKYVEKSFVAASAVTAVSHATAKSLGGSFGVTNAPVIFNFVDTRLFCPIQRHNPKERPFRLLFVGNLTPRKGADLLPLIMNKLGEGFELRYTTGLRDNRLAETAPNMISIGKLTSDSELITAYRACDALLFPSRLEGLPIAPLEAMACGKPVIATRTSSLPEVVEDGVTGILCEPENVHAFALACEKLAGNRQLLEQYGAAARDRVERLFSESIVIPQYISLYEKLGH